MPLAPEYAAMLAQLAEQPGPALTDLSPADAREVYRAMRPVDESIFVASVNDWKVPGPAGDIPVRIYTPHGDGPFPVFVNFHGGGWVIGDLDTADAACRGLCATANVVVVSVDYRLAPEHVYPAAVDDCYAATCWAAGNYDMLNGSGKLAVGGESAGGNLAAIVCLKARDEAGPAIDFQLLLYPVTDADLSRGSYVENGEGYFLETSTMKWFWDYYCPEAQRSESFASPLHASDHSRLPAALVVTAEFDPLRDEGEHYAQILRAAGVPAETKRCDGLVHDFIATAQVFEASRGPFEDICAKLTAALR